MANPRMIDCHHPMCQDGVWLLDGVAPVTCLVCGGDGEIENPDYDPTPWCRGCGAMRKVDCHCGPLAEND